MHKHKDILAEVLMLFGALFVAGLAAMLVFTIVTLAHCANKQKTVAPTNCVKPNNEIVLTPPKPDQLSDEAITRGEEAWATVGWAVGRGGGDFGTMHQIVARIQAGHTDALKEWIGAQEEAVHNAINKTIIYCATNADFSVCPTNVVPITTNDVHVIKMRGRW